MNNIFCKRFYELFHVLCRFVGAHRAASADDPGYDAEDVEQGRGVAPLEAGDGAQAARTGKSAQKLATEHINLLTTARF